MIYTRYKRITRFSQQLSPEIINPNNGFTSYIYKEEKKPQNSSRWGPEFVLTRLSVDRPSTDPSVWSTARSTAQSPQELQDLLKMSVDRVIDRPNWVPVPRATSVDRPDLNLVHVGRPPGRPKSCHRVKKLYLLF